jgi:hypothetical protein
MTEIELTRGDTNEFTVTITAPDGDGVYQPLEIGFSDLWFTLKYDWDDDDVDAIVQKTVGNGITVSSPTSAGIAVVRLEPEDTEDLIGPQRLVYDVQLKESDDTITTVASGYANLVRDATRATI